LDSLYRSGRLDVQGALEVVTEDGPEDRLGLNSMSYSSQGEVDRCGGNLRENECCTNFGISELKGSGTVGEWKGSGTVGGYENALDLTKSGSGEIMAMGSVGRILEEAGKIGEQFLTFQEEPKVNSFVTENVNFKKN
jgi:hypothetical protein